MTNSRSNDNSLDIQTSFNATILKSQLPDALIDIGESSIDELLDNTLIKQLPVIKTIAGIIQAGVNIHDRLFLKKLLAFLGGVKDITPEERKRMINEIDASQTYRLKVGEKLLYILDANKDYEESEDTTKLFCEFIKGNISYDQYLSATDTLNRISRIELNEFFDNYALLHFYNETKNIAHLTHTGLLNVSISQVEVEVSKDEPADYEEALNGERYDANVYGGDLELESSLTGKILFDVLANDLQKDKFKKARMAQEERQAKIFNEVRERRDKEKKK